MQSRPSISIFNVYFVLKTVTSKSLFLVVSVCNKFGTGSEQNFTNIMQIKSPKGVCTISCINFQKVLLVVN